MIHLNIDAFISSKIKPPGLHIEASPEVSVVQVNFIFRINYSGREIFNRVPRTLFDADFAAIA